MDIIGMMKQAFASVPPARPGLMYLQQHLCSQPHCVRCCGDAGMQPHQLIWSQLQSMTYRWYAPEKMPVTVL